MRSVDAFSRCVRSMCSDPLIQLKVRSLNSVKSVGRVRSNKEWTFGRCVQSMRSVDAFGLTDQ